MDMLCSDKTGTLTQNKLTLGEPFSVDGVAAERGDPDAALASRAENKDTIDLAVLGGLKDEQVLKSYRVVPFPAVRPGPQAHRGHRERPDGRRSRSQRARRR